MFRKKSKFNEINKLHSLRFLLEKLRRGYFVFINPEDFFDPFRDATKRLALKRVGSLCSLEKLLKRSPDLLLCRLNNDGQWEATMAAKDLELILESYLVRARGNEPPCDSFNSIRLTYLDTLLRGLVTNSSRECLDLERGLSALVNEALEFKEESMRAAFSSPLALCYYLKNTTSAPLRFSSSDPTLDFTLTVLVRAPGSYAPIGLMFEKAIFEDLFTSSISQFGSRFHAFNSSDVNPTLLEGFLSASFPVSRAGRMSQLILEVAESSLDKRVQSDSFYTRDFTRELSIPALESAGKTFQALN